MTKKSIIEGRVKIREQSKEWFQKVLGIKVTCAGCNNKVNFFVMYRCYYCGLMYCTACAKEHFETITWKWIFKKIINKVWRSCSSK